MTIALRVIPPVIRTARRPQRMIERSLMVYRRTWIIIVPGFFEPLFYLLSTRVGLGRLVGDVSVNGKVVDYATFVAPALMASSAMNGAVYDSTMNVFDKLKHSKTYDAVLATPMGIGDVTLGEIGWALLRGLLYATTFLLAMLMLETVHSSWALMAIPACVLIGLAFASCGLAAVTFIRSWADFGWVPTATMPLFLFSATFYPASSLWQVASVVADLAAVSPRGPRPFGDHRNCRLVDPRLRGVPPGDGLLRPVGRLETTQPPAALLTVARSKTSPEGLDERATISAHCGDAAFEQGAGMSGFLDKAKEMAENVKDKIEDKLPDSVKEKLHIGDHKAQADEATAPVAEAATATATATEDAATGTAASVSDAADTAEDKSGGALDDVEDKGEEIENTASDTIEDAIPGDKGGDGH